MKRIFIPLLLLLALRGKAQTNTYYTGGYKFMDNITVNPSVGFFNPIAFALRQGRILFPDEEFATGVNDVSIYDNNSTGQVTISRVNTIADLPNSSGYGLQIKHTGSGETPGYGGFYQLINSGINKTIVQLFRANLPAGYQFNATSNSIGTYGLDYWLTNNNGTGKWEWYIRVVQCGNGGTFSSSGFIYVTGDTAPTSAAPLIWYLSSCTAFDVTNVNSYQGNNILNQNTIDQNSSFRISGNGIIGGNILVGKTSQSNSSYKLDVNGDARINKIVVNTTGADYVFDSTYHLMPMDSLNNYIKANHHLPEINSAKQMQQQGIDVGENVTKLLKKIEELTLIVIEQNERIAKLELNSKATKEK